MKPEQDGRVRCSAWLGRVIRSAREVLAQMWGRWRNPRSLQSMAESPVVLSSLVESSDIARQVSVERLGDLVSPCPRLSPRGVRAPRSHLSPRGPSHARSRPALFRIVGACLKALRRSKSSAWVERPNDPSSATRPTRRDDCNSSAMAGFAAAHG